MDDYEWKLTIRPGRKGGPGSGHHGHAGRPGKRGGSAPGKGGGGKDFSSAATEGRISTSGPLGGGVTESKLIQYKDDGRGVWKEMTNLSGMHDGNSEVAAYRVSDLLDLDIVPPTVFSKDDRGRLGTSQMFIEDATVGLDVARANGLNVYNPVRTATMLRRRNPEMKDRIERMVLLDYIIGNTDRHLGNVVLGPDNKLWAIDHGHAVWQDLGSKTTLNDWLRTSRHDLSPGLKQKIMDLTRDDFMGAMTGISTERNVRLNEAWNRIERLQQSGGKL